MQATLEYFRTQFLKIGCESKDFTVVTYEIRVFFEGAQKEVFSSIFKKTL